MLPESANSDVCLILEGTYPYTMGGVSSWTHDLIKMQKHLKFSIVAMISANATPKMMYELPDNVVSLQTLRLQRMPRGVSLLPMAKEEELFKRLEAPMIRMQSQANLSDLAEIINAIRPYHYKLGQRLLLDSKPAWDMLLRMYNATMPKTSFLDYFWSWRGLFGGVFSVLLANIPPAKSYHALCTGYAGLLLARARLETGRPCVVTEHGIYTNERRIEIASADWLDDPTTFNLAVSVAGHDREIKDLWIDVFGNYSRLCYGACSKIITLYEDNQEFQRMDGAEDNKLMIIPNGIDYEHYRAIKRVPHDPAIALIGRVVPIKDIKTYIKAVAILKESMPKITAYIIGPEDEEAEYASECRELVSHLDLGDSIVFTGKVKIEEYLGKIDVIVLTSISEAQPLVILEAGAAGVPTVATDVGSCREMIMGNVHEKPALGIGGAVVPLANPRAVAEALLKLLQDEEYYKTCRTNIRKRVKSYYNKEDQFNAYAGLYKALMGNGGEHYSIQDILKEVA